MTAHPELHGLYPPPPHGPRMGAIVLLALCAVASVLLFPLSLAILLGLTLASKIGKSKL